ncbi:MAG TPA: aspartate--tRNA ligase [Candidatus Saccharibacteria bacterium]|nr:aspartate--tRNA ligase [Candidatus Saccharibacteria bacterium]
MRTLAIDSPQQVGKTISACGWVHSRRDHGGLVFIDLRDHTGLLQLVIHPEAAEAFKIADELRDEFVARATGEVKERDDALKNDKIPTGSIELVVQELTILNRSEVLPIQPFAEAQANEELRLKYRYLDLRRPKMQERLKQRAEYYRFLRSYMEEHDFIEVTTPILANSSPEGARDFLVPSRVHPGKFYALPQAPQQFKQLLMVGGVPRYYQIATCFRDEDPRADRLYGDFYQLDLEMAFVSEGEEVRRTMEPLITQLVTDFAGKKLLHEDVPRIPYTEAMERYGSDKPDLRFGMELVELTDVFKDSGFGVFKNAAASEGGAVKAICVKGGASLSRSQIDKFTEIAKSEGAGGLAYLTYKDGEVQSPIAKFMNEAELTEVKNRSQADDGDAVFFGADTRGVVNKVLGRLRNEFAEYFELKDPTVVALVWIVDFPFYERDEKTGKLDFGHNPFSMPKASLAELDSVQNKLDIVADQYDMVMNGYEICSGGVRNHNPEVLYKVFGLLDFTPEYVEEKFGAMLNAFKYGAPPHAGCAFGLDRIFMVLTGEDNIREVVAFPKNGSGVDLMMNSPSTVDDHQLKDLSLKSIE